MAANNGSATLRHIYAPVPQTTRGQSISFKSDNKGDRIVYTCGRSVVIRDVANPLLTDCYVQHATTATAAAWSPSGFYCASGDESGRLRIWDTVNAEHILSAEYPVLSGKIYDICWSSDSERLVIVGDGRERFGAAILAKTGSSVGSISGHSKVILSCSMKPTRPFRCVTGSEDFTTGFFEGPPFKFQHAEPGTRFVNCVAYAPDGERFLSASSDSKIYIADGKTGARTGELSGHTGSVYSAAWSPDSRFILSASADKTCKVWDVASLTCVETFTLGTTVDDMQVSCLWVKDTLLSVSLSGAINVLDRQNPAAPRAVIMGHKVPVLAVNFDATSRTIFSASYDGRVVAWDFDASTMALLSGSAHSAGAQISAMALTGDTLVSVAMDDTVAFNNARTRSFGSAIKLEGTPYAVAVSADGSTAFVAYNGGVAVVRAGGVASTTALSNSPQAIAVSASGDIAVGCSDGVHIFTLSGDALTAKTSLTGYRGQIVALAYSNDGAMLASADSSRQILIHNSADYSAKVAAGTFVHHTAKVTKLAFSPDASHLASSSLDASIIVWTPNAPGSRITLANAHVGGVQSVAWIDDQTIASGGADAAVKTWNLQY
eukprot:a175102_367.p2 GENE.a175102_367~~a175102_367.p2  ORF type:complete len:613 (-),score=273.80 a175102_367:28-1839(-)